MSEAAESADAASSSEGQLFTPADLRSGVQLQTGDTVKISVKGVFGKPLPGGPNAHILAALVRSIGDVIAPNHGVNVYASDGTKIGSGTTDENGMIHMQVPKDDKYRIELIEPEEDGGAVEEHAALPQSQDTDAFHRVVARFFDDKGKALAGVAVLVDGVDAGLVTDDDGVFDIPADLKAYELSVSGQKFSVHAMPSEDHDKSPSNASIFYLAAAAGGDQETA